jgi:DDE superfamily endonuclease
MKETVVGLFILKMYVDSQRQEGNDFNNYFLTDDDGKHNKSPWIRHVLDHPIILQALQMYIIASQQRYLLPRTVRDRPVNKYEIDLNPLPVNGESLPWLTETEFVTAYRMTRRAFHRLVDLIKDHPVFQAPKRGCPQYPVEQQLLTLLHYLSSRGSEASSARTRNHFHISYGSKDRYIDRCVKAIRSCMRSTYYKWPDAEERTKLARDFKNEFQLPNAILVVDGTTFRLMSRPEREDAADYSGRKEGYTITNLIFSDAQRRIRYYVAGWAGCVHDNRMWNTCKVFRQSSSYFSPSQYAIGDSAFDNGPHMVTTYKAPTGGLLRGSKKGFNDILSSPRVISEHVNGILKGRWSWLNCIPCVLNEDPKSMERILKFIDVTVILHNFLIQERLNEDQTVFYDEKRKRCQPLNNDDFLMDENDELNQGISATAPSGRRREQLRAYLSERGVL